MAIQRVRSPFAQFRLTGAVAGGRVRTVWVKVDADDLPDVKKYVWHMVSDLNSVYPGTRLPDGTWTSLGRYLCGDGGYGPLGRIDHINGNTMDHRRANLRVATQSTVLAKRKPTGGSSKYKGVTWDKQQNKWLAAFRGRKIGRFHVEEDAARAFDETALNYWGVENRPYLNFPVSPRGVPMNGANARRAIHALDACLRSQDAQDDPGLRATLKAAQEALEKWAVEPREWIQPRDIGWTETRVAEG